jgi:hypothetical protein
MKLIWLHYDMFIENFIVYYAYNDLLHILDVKNVAYFQFPLKKDENTRFHKKNYVLNLFPMTWIGLIRTDLAAIWL